MDRKTHFASARNNPGVVTSLMKAMILAAGRGERMRPLTDNTPKPLLEVQGKPLIFWHLEKLARAGVSDVVINTAWLGAALENAIGNGAQWGVQVHWSREPSGGLETAGGIIQALPLLGNAPFWVINGDIWTDFDFNLLPPTLAEEQLGHLVLVANPPHNERGDFGLAADSKIVAFEPRYTFSGMSMLHPKLFTGHAPGRLALRPLFEQAISHSLLTGQLHHGLWTDVGTPARLLGLNQHTQAES